MDRIARLSHHSQYSIHDAAQICGLTPSVIRVWEERYGWPSPRRQHNGYRAFSALEIEELKRVAALVKTGTPISRIIVDGLPVFPKDTSRPAPQYDLRLARAVPTGASRAAAGARDGIVTALEQRHDGRVLEALQRACIELRTADELTGVLVPALVGLVELHQLERILPHEAEVLQLIGERGAQLAKRFPTGGEPVTISPLADGDLPVANLVAALLAQRGQAVRVVAVGAPAMVVASLRPGRPADGTVTVVTALPCEGCVPLASLADPNRPREALLDVTQSPVLAAG